MKPNQHKLPALLLVLLALVAGYGLKATPADQSQNGKASGLFDRQILKNASEMLNEGRRIFRFDTFGDEAFWGGALRLHEAIAEATPRTALGLGLKVDVDALPQELA